MKIKRLIAVGLITVLGGVTASYAGAPPKCSYHEAYMQCTTASGQTVTYKPNKKYKVCPPNSDCYWTYCYKHYGCHDYYPDSNRLY